VRRGRRRRSGKLLPEAESESGLRQRYGAAAAHSLGTASLVAPPRCPRSTGTALALPFTVRECLPMCTGSATGVTASAALPHALAHTGKLEANSDSESRAESADGLRLRLPGRRTCPVKPEGPHVRTSGCTTG